MVLLTFHWCHNSDSFYLFILRYIEFKQQTAEGLDITIVEFHLYFSYGNYIWCIWLPYKLFYPVMVSHFVDHHYNYWCNQWNLSHHDEPHGLENVSVLMRGPFHSNTLHLYKSFIIHFKGFSYILTINPVFVLSSCLLLWFLQYYADL